MKKLRSLQLLFSMVALFAFIPLTIAVYGDKNPDTIIAWAVVVALGIIGNSVCAIIRVICESKKN